MLEIGWLAAGLVLGGATAVHVFRMRYAVVQWVPGKNAMVLYRIKTFRSKEQAIRYASHRIQHGAFWLTVEDLMKGQ